MELTNSIKIGFILGLPLLGMVSCTSSGDNPGIEYAPQMYVSDAYEPYSQEKSYENNPNGMSMRLPVNGTIARGQGIYNYPYPTGAEGYDASAELASWIAPTKSNIAEGERLYMTYCWHCHGKKGKNDGPIFKDKKMPAPAWPGYESDYIKELPVGKAYHTISYGKGLMGPHSFLLNPDERWQVVHYVKSLAYGDSYEFAPENMTNAHLENREQYTRNGYFSPAAASNHQNNGHSSSHDGMHSSDHTFPGTPAEKAMIMSAMAKVEFKGIPNRKEIKDKSFGSLDQVAQYLTDHPEYKANLVGHTGMTLTEEGAENLGIDRAKSVKAYLVSKGVNAANLSTRTDADASMEGEVTSSEDRKANRRVEIEIYN